MRGTSLACLCLLPGVAWLIAAEAPKPTRPNVLMIVGDDMAWTDYEFMGHPDVKTPNLDRLAREGAVFPSAYVPTSLCRASLATLLTGQYAHQHKICCNDPPKGTDRAEMLPFLQHASTIPRTLGEKAGYLSLQTGKFWEGPFSNGGFTDGMTTKGRHGDEGLKIGRETLQPIDDFLDKAGEKPWFIWYAPMMPHAPHTPPAKYLERYKKAGINERVARYYAMCEWFDATIGDVLASLEKRKLLDNTLVVYVADNGWIQSPGAPKAGEQFATRSKNTPYEGGVRTPVILRWPAKIKPTKVAEPISTIDLMPTILSACGIERPANLLGIDLLSLAAGTPSKRERVFGEIYTHDCVEVGKPQLSVTHRWVREGKWKLILPTAKVLQIELFDVEADPHEKVNRADEQRVVVARLAQALDALWTPMR